MKKSDFKRTKISIILPTGYTCGEWIASKYYERFGTDELITLINNKDKEKAMIWWNKEVRQKENPTLTNEEFTEWFHFLDKQRPKKMPVEQFALSMIQTAFILGPNVVEDKIFTEENVFSTDSTTLVDYAAITNPV